MLDQDERNDLVPIHVFISTSYGSGKSSSLLPLLIEHLGHHGVSVIRTNEATGVNGGAYPSFRRAISVSDIVIADITDHIPNVMYELGFAHALRKPVLTLVRDGSEPVPEDLQGFPFILYDPLNVGGLTQQVDRWIARHSPVRSVA